MFRPALRLGLRALQRPARPRGRANIPPGGWRQGCAAPRALHFPPCHALSRAAELVLSGRVPCARLWWLACTTPSPSACALASVPRWRASPQTRPRRSNTRLRRFAPQPSRRAEPAPPAVNAPQNLRHPFHGDRQALLPLGQLVDFPYRLGDVVDSQQSPSFVLIDRLGLLTLVDLVDFPIGQAPRRCPSWRKPSSSSAHAITTSPPPLWLRRDRHRLHRRIRFCLWRLDSRQRAPNAAISSRRSSPTYSTAAGFGLPECSNSRSPPAALRAPGALLSARRIRVIRPCSGSNQTSNGWPSASRRCPPNGNSA